MKRRRIPSFSWIWAHLKKKQTTKRQKKLLANSRTFSKLKRYGLCAPSLKSPFREENRRRKRSESRRSTTVCFKSKSSELFKSIFSNWLLYFLRNSSLKVVSLKPKTLKRVMPTINFKEALLKESSKKGRLRNRTSNFCTYAEL